MMLGKERKWKCHFLLGFAQAKSGLLGSDHEESEFEHWRSAGGLQSPRKVTVRQPPAGFQHWGSTGEDCCCNGPSLLRKGGLKSAVRRVTVTPCLEPALPRSGRGCWRGACAATSSAVASTWFAVTAGCTISLGQVFLLVLTFLEVGLVPAATLESESDYRDQFLQARLIAGWAIAQLRIAEFLNDF